jgi:hypothetical protein
VFVGHPFHVMQGFFHLAQMAVDDGPRKTNDRRRARRHELQQLEALPPVFPGSTAPERFPERLAIEGQAPGSLPADYRCRFFVPAKRFVL